MIKLTDLEGNKYNFEITKFPDGTSQLWKVNPEPKRMTNMIVTWMFESEAELFPVLQLGELLYTHFKCFPTLNCPYLMYARQDKRVSNETTFARDLFLKLAATAGYTKIKAYDAHSGSVYVESEEPRVLMERALEGIDVVCFPDKGAKERYSKLLKSINPDMKVICGNKRRNQQSGVIEGLELEVPENFVISEFMNVLVFDDLCDGGRTFVDVANKLKEEFSQSSILSLNLAVSHGLFTKGLDILYNSGYSHIYTTNTLLRNIAFEGIGEIHGSEGLFKFTCIEVIK